MGPSKLAFTPQTVGLDVCRGSRLVALHRPQHQKACHDGEILYKILGFMTLAQALVDVPKVVPA